MQLKSNFPLHLSAQCQRRDAVSGTGTWAGHSEGLRAPGGELGGGGMAWPGDVDVGTVVLGAPDAVLLGGVLGGPLPAVVAGLLPEGDAAAVLLPGLCPVGA